MIAEAKLPRRFALAVDDLPQANRRATSGPVTEGRETGGSDAN
jgi:hypothetical protein